MKPADLDAVEAAALRDAPRCAACGALATRACVGCHSTWCGSHDGTAGAPPCPDGMAPLRADVRLTLARALREAWAERDAARVASAPSEREAMLRAALDNREAFARDLTAVVGAAERERDALRAIVEGSDGSEKVVTAKPIPAAPSSGYTETLDREGRVVGCYRDGDPAIEGAFRTPGWSIRPARTRPVADAATGDGGAR